MYNKKKHNKLKRGREKGEKTVCHGDPQRYWTSLEGEVSYKNNKHIIYFHNNKKKTFF